MNRTENATLEEQEGAVNLLDLATCHVTQHTVGHEKSDWSLQLNESNEELITISKSLNEQSIFSLLDFMKKYELKAFNTGISFQKNKQNQYLKSIIDEQQAVITALKEENERLASILENIIGEQK